MKPIEVIRCSIADSDDYSHIVDSAIHNTLGQLWKWAEEQGVNVSFEKHIENDDASYSLLLRVTAKFYSDTDKALFKLSYSDLPYRQFSMNSMEPIFY